MKKTLLTILSAAALTASAIAFSACTDGTQKIDKFGAIETAEQAYAFSAATAGTLISSMNGGRAAALAQTKSVAFGEQVTDQETIEELNGYMMLVESLLADGAFGTTESASDREEYTTKVVITYKDMLGNTLDYTMYYNEELLPDNDRDDDDDDDEIEEEYAIEGVMLVDGNEYAIRGEKETETEGDEWETETKFRVSLGETQTMLVEQKTEKERGEEEQEFVYSVYEGRTLLERSSFEYEQEDGETELKFSITKDGSTQIFYFEREKEHGEEVIKIKKGDKNSAEKYRVFIQTDENGNTSYVYEYAGKRIPMQRPAHD